MHVEKDDEGEVVEAYGVLQFPTIVWTDAEGKEVATTIHPEGPADALKDLTFARKWIRGEVNLDE